MKKTKVKKMLDRATTTTELQLWCAVYREESVFPVSIASDATVYALQQAICVMQRYAERLQLSPSDLTLYVARQQTSDGESQWLMVDDDGFRRLLRGSTDESYEKMHATLRLDDATYFGEAFAPQRGQIHVLVELPEDADVPMRKKMRRSPWQVTRPTPQRSYDATSDHIVLEPEELEDTGVGDERVALYCRPMFHRQMEFLRDDVLTKGHLGWIMGPPGTGKSSTALAFALTVDRREWVVTWIGVGDVDDFWSCVQLVNGERRHRVLLNFSDVEEVLNAMDSRPHVVLVDGWTPPTQPSQLTRVCCKWFRDKNAVSPRRLAFVCATNTRGKFREQPRRLSRSKEFPVFSWTLDEYLDAITCDAVFESVVSCLDACASTSDTPPASRQEMVNAKYYYAGGSCRYMFGIPTRVVLHEVHHDVTELVVRSGVRPESLYAMYPRSSTSLGDGNRSRSSLVSPYAAARLATTYDLDGINHLLWLLRWQWSSTTTGDGMKLELRFFGSLRYEGLDLVDATGRTVDTWDRYRGVFHDDDGPSLHWVEGREWIKPTTWHEGGYDAIKTCTSSQSVVFVQLADLHARSLRLERFREWLTKLTTTCERFVGLKRVEIVVLVRNQRALETFALETVTGEGLLEPFGWRRQEETTRVRVVAMRGHHGLIECGGS